MSYWYLAPRFAVLATYVASGSFIHFRGRVRHKLRRQVLDHSTIMAPYNVLIYLFSKVRAKPYVEPKNFPELQPLQDQWQMIRDRKSVV